MTTSDRDSTAVTLQLTCGAAPPTCGLQAAGPRRPPGLPTPGSPTSRPAAGCTRPIRLAGDHVTPSTPPPAGVLHRSVDTADLPDGVIYKACGNRRASVCPSCAAAYQRDAYQLIRAGLVGGKGVPDTVAHASGRVRHLHRTLVRPRAHPRRHAAHLREPAPLRLPARTLPRPPRPDRLPARRPAGLLRPPRRRRPAPRHAAVPGLLRPRRTRSCGTCMAGELWRRTTIAVDRYLRRSPHAASPTTAASTPARTLVPPSGSRTARSPRCNAAPSCTSTPSSASTAADPDDPDADPAAPGRPRRRRPGRRRRPRRRHRRVHHRPAPGPARTAGPSAGASRSTPASSPSPPTARSPTAWSPRYLAKYATKSTEATGHTSGRLTDDTIDRATPTPTARHTERLVDACWTLGRRRRDWRAAAPVGAHARLRRPLPHQEPPLLHHLRHPAQRPHRLPPHRTPPAPNATPAAPSEPTTLVVNFLQFVGAGWHTTGDAMLANTAAALAREHHDTARTELAALAAA